MHDPNPSSHSYIPSPNASHPQSDYDDVSSTPPETSQGNKKGGRGPTRLPRSWDDIKLRVEFNEHNQPIGENAPKLAHQMGRVVRDANKFPPSTKDWRQIDRSNKEAKWLELKLGKLWREWKAELKKFHYSIYETDEERLAHLPPRMDKVEWEKLVNIWSNDPHARKISEQNRANRTQLRTYHRTGKKGYPSLRAEMFIEKGEEPSNFDVWMKANTPKNGQHDAYTASTIERLTNLISENPEAMNSKEMKDQILDVVLGPEKHGRLRTYGFV
ncbi:hypothetical protein ACJIZ3_023399 [Penstemon smallii]|uniref:Uncharacterized protein n=1 Tax=Penstemon smallii TaxID=265156 RepID=A0ABD3TQX9_9LAMI